MRETTQSGGEIKEHEYNDNNGTRILFTCIPIDTSDGYPDTLIGTEMNGAFWIDTSRPKSIIRKKEKQHRKSNLPQIISYACNDPHLVSSNDEEVAIRTLYGALQYSIPRDAITQELLHDKAHPSRSKDGLWIPTNIRSTDNPKLVIWIENLHPWSICKSKCMLWVNPFGGLDFFEQAWKGTTAKVTANGDIEFSSGRSLAELVTWPCHHD